MNLIQKTLQYSVKLTLTAILFISLQSLNSCKNLSQQSKEACISKKIEEVKNSSEKNGIVRISSYYFNNKKVFYFMNELPDKYNSLYDADCNLICYPDGGITGKGDGKCSDFFESRSKEELIWAVKK